MFNIGLSNLSLRDVFFTSTAAHDALIKSNIIQFNQYFQRNLCTRSCYAQIYATTCLSNLEQAFNIGYILLILVKSNTLSNLYYKFQFEFGRMIQQTIEQVKFEHVMIAKLQNQARRTNKLIHWLQYLNALDQNINYEDKDKTINQMHQRYVLNQEFWLKQINRKFNQPKFNQNSINFAFMALEDGFYFQAAKLIAAKLQAQLKQNKLRLNFVIAKSEALIQHFNHRKKQGAYFYKSIRQIYKLNNNKKKIRQTYHRQIKMHFDDFDIVYDEYDIWEVSNKQIAKQQYQQLFTNAKAQWQLDQQYFQQTYFNLVVKIMQNYKTQNQQPNGLFLNTCKRSRVHILRALQQIQDKNTSKLDQEKYTWLLSFLPTQKQKLWFLRRIAFIRHQLYQQYLQTLQIVNQQDEEKLINTHKTIVSLNLEYTDAFKFQSIYLQYLVRRFNRHLHQKQSQQYNQTWGAKVQYFRNQVSEMILKTRPRPDLQLQSMRVLYNFWLDVEAALVKDKQALSHLFQSVILQNPSLELYIKYSNQMLKLSDIKLAKQILKRACQTFKFNPIIVEQIQKFYAIYGEINQICKFKQQRREHREKQKSREIYQLSQSKFNYSTFSKGNQSLVPKKNSYIASKSSSQKGKQPQCQKIINQSKVQYNIQQNNKNIVQSSKQQNNQQKFKRAQSAVNPSQQLQQKITSLQRKKHHSDNQNTIFIKKIPLNWVQADILNILKYKDHVKQVRLIFKNGQKKDYCYVDYQEEEWSFKQIKQNKTSFQMKISHPPSAFDQSKTIFVCALPKTATKQAIIELISQNQRQNVAQIRMKLQNDRNYAYIDFIDNQSKNKVLDQSKDRKLLVDGKKVIFQQCDSDRIKGKKFVKVVYMKNLSFKCKEQDIRQFFHQKNIQSITKIIIPKNQKDKSKGFAYVEFQKFKDYQNALDLKRGQLMNRNIQILKSDREITEQNHKRRQSQTEFISSKKQLKPKEKQVAAKNNNFFSYMFK